MTITKPRVLESGLALVLAITVWGSYAYQMSLGGDVRGERLVRITLTQAGSASLTPTIGPNVRSLDGRILGVTPYDIRLAVTQIERVVGPVQFLAGESVIIPRESARAITMKAFEPFRTTRAIAGILGGVLAGNAMRPQTGMFSVKRAVPVGSK